MLRLHLPLLFHLLGYFFLLSFKDRFPIKICLRHRIRDQTNGAQCIIIARNNEIDVIGITVCIGNPYDRNFKLGSLLYGDCL